MRLNSGQNLHQFLTNSRSNSQKTNSNYNKIYNNTKIYNQSKSNINIINIENASKRFNLFSNLNSKQKEKINLTKFLKGDKNYYNNINLITEQNLNKKHEPNKLNLNLSFLSNLAKNGKGNSFKTLNYDRSSFVRIMKYFTIKSSNKPLKFDELSPVFIPIRNTLSNEHRKNNLNINSDNIKDKINFYYYINSKEKVIQLFKNNKKNSKYISSNISHRSGTGTKNSIKNNLKTNVKNNNNNNSNSNNNESGNCSTSNNNNKINNINLINKNDQRNSIHNKASDNNLTFSKNSNESEFTFKDKGSAIINLENKKSNNKDNSNESSRNNNDNTHNHIMNSDLNSFAEKDNKKNNNNNKQMLGNNNEMNKNSNCHLAISIEKINNKERNDDINNNNNDYSKKNQVKYNYNVMTNEEKKADDYENSPQFLNEKMINNLVNKKNYYKNITNQKSSNLLDKILNNQKANKNIKLENDINLNNINNLNNNNKNMNTIDNNENNDSKNNLKNSYQFRIRKINLPSGINLASIQHNNKLLQNIINKKSKNKGVLNSNKISVAQTEYKVMKGEKMMDENKNLYNIDEKKKNGVKYNVNNIKKCKK